MKPVKWRLWCREGEVFRLKPQRVVMLNKRQKKGDHNVVPSGFNNRGEKVSLLTPVMGY
jgi:hypothetical protein